MKLCRVGIFSLCLLLVLTSCTTPGPKPVSVETVITDHQAVLRLAIMITTRQILRAQPLLKAQVIAWSGTLTTVLQTVDVAALHPVLVATFPASWNNDTRYWVGTLLDAVLAEVTTALRNVQSPAVVKTILGHVLGWIHDAALSA